MFFDSSVGSSLCPTICLEHWSEYDCWTSSSGHSVTWELVRNADFELETHCGPGSLFHKPS